MKKIVFKSILFLVFTGLVFAFPTYAGNEDRPKGLEDRGPLTKITFIHYKKGFAKPPQTPGGKKENGGPSCYGFLGKGVLWRTLPQSVVINPKNGDRLSESFIVESVGKSMETWDAETSKDLFSSSSVDYQADWDDDSPDGRNEIVFGIYPNQNTIAVTVVWGYFSGPPSTREIVEFDILFNDLYQWGDARINPSLMDLENIATHEGGHGWGLDDIYDPGCSAVTMYGYSGEGDTGKRTLEPPDVKGIQELYGV